MKVRYGILNEGENAWLFGDLAKNLSRVLEIEIVKSPSDINYVLSWGNENWDKSRINSCRRMFIPHKSIKIASDKRILTRLFKKNKIPSPRTYLCERYEVDSILEKQSKRVWCVKWPFGCGASGHKIIKTSADIKSSWPTPIILQEFISLEKPIVYRMYCAGRRLFGWNKREFDEQTKQSPWVAHARGARYVALDHPNQKVLDLCEYTFRVTGLYESFGCIDLLQDRKGDWLVLETGTDGIFNYVDRDIGISEIEKKIDLYIADAFRKKKF